MKKGTPLELTPSEFASLRRSHNFTQSKLAAYINEHFTHCTPQTISRWETNRSRMPFYALIALRALIAYKEKGREYLPKADLNNAIFRHPLAKALRKEEQFAKEKALCNLSLSLSENLLGESVNDFQNKWKSLTKSLRKFTNRKNIT